jgi:hypothetical protein
LHLSPPTPTAPSVQKPPLGRLSHPSFDWLLGDRLIWWFLFIALPALIIYALGHLLRFW